eukprot:RCo007399
MAHVSDESSPPDLRIIHFADSHRIISNARKEPAGGISRLATVVAHKRADYGEQLLVLFSGDTFSPSLLSTLMRGQQVIPVFQALRVDAGMFGNHDFDFGVDELRQLADGCDMPWVMTNLVDARTDRPIAGSLASVLLTVGRLKVGVMGIAEQEWLKTIRDLPSYVEYRDKFSCAQAEAQRLRQAGADLVIALTHQRESNDRDLLRRVPEIDLALGGHDHYPLHVVEAGTTLVKSGADCRSTSFVEVWKPADPGGKPEVRVELINLMTAIAEDPTVQSILESFEDYLSEKLSTPLCHISDDLDVITASVRTRESSIGNIVADAMRKEMSADVALLNSGSLRADVVYPAGSLITVKDVLDIFPVEDVVIKISLQGSDLRAALESGVGRYPAHEGRFPAVSGMRVVFDAVAPSGSRLVEVRISGSPLDDEKTYSVACTDYMFRGGDGYASLGSCVAVLVDPENGRILPEIVKDALQQSSSTRSSADGLSRVWSGIDGRLVIHRLVPKLSLAQIRCSSCSSPVSGSMPLIPRSFTMANLLGKSPQDPSLARHNDVSARRSPSFRLGVPGSPLRCPSHRRSPVGFSLSAASFGSPKAFSCVTSTSFRSATSLTSAPSTVVDTVFTIPALSLGGTSNREPGTHPSAKPPVVLSAPDATPPVVPIIQLLVEEAEAKETEEIAPIPTCVSEQSLQATSPNSHTRRCSDTDSVDACAASPVSSRISELCSEPQPSSSSPAAAVHAREQLQCSSPPRCHTRFSSPGITRPMQITGTPQSSQSSASHSPPPNRTPVRLSSLIDGLLVSRASDVNADSHSSSSSSASCVLASTLVGLRSTEASGTRLQTLGCRRTSQATLDHRGSSPGKEHPQLPGETAHEKSPRILAHSSFSMPPPSVGQSRDPPLTRSSSQLLRSPGSTAADPSQLPVPPNATTILHASANTETRCYARTPLAFPGDSQPFPSEGIVTPVMMDVFGLPEHSLVRPHRRRMGQLRAASKPTVGTAFEQGTLIKKRESSGVGAAGASTTGCASTLGSRVRKPT